MGSYLSHPVTTKETEIGESDSLRFACTAMQGWRTEMEDAHIMIPNIGGNLNGVSMFSVCMHSQFPFLSMKLGDGHGGREVARFVKNWLPKEAQRIGDICDLSSTLVSLYNRYAVKIDFFIDVHIEWTSFCAVQITKRSYCPIAPPILRLIWIRLALKQVKTLALCLFCKDPFKMIYRSFERNGAKFLETRQLKS